MAQSYEGRLRHLSSYDLNHLVAHMAEDGDHENLHRLLLMVEDSAGAPKVNAWYAARIASGHVDGYLEDVRRAGRVAEREAHGQFSRGEAAPALVQAWCYALIEATVISSADNINPKLLSRLVADEVWPAAQALAFARRVPEPAPRATALAAVIQLGGPEADRLADEAMALIRGISHPLHRVRAAAALLIAVDEERRAALLAETLDLISEIDDEDWRAVTFVVLSSVLTVEEAADALTRLDDFERENAWVSAAAALIDRIPDPLTSAVLADLPHADDATRAFVARPVAALQDGQELLDHLWCGIDGWRVRALTASGAPLATPLLEQCLAVAWSLADPAAAAWTVAGLVPYVAGEDRRRQIRDLLAHTQEHRGNPEVVGALASIESLLTTDERLHAFVIAAEEVNSLLGVRSVAMLAREIHEPLRGQTYADMVRIAIGQGDESGAAETIAAVAPHVPHEYIALVIDAARRLRDPASAAMALGAVAEVAPDGQAEELVRAAATAALTIEEEQQRAEELIALAPMLPVDLAVEINAAVSRFTDQDLAFHVRSALMPLFPEQLMSPQLIAALAEHAQARPAPSSELSAIVRASRLAPLMPASTVTELLDDTARLTDPQERIIALTELLPHAKAAGIRPSADLVQGAVAAVPDDPWRRAVSLVRLANALPDQWADSVYEDAMAAAVAVARADEPEDGLRRRTLTTVAAALPGRLRPRLLTVLPRLSTDQDRERWTPDHVVAAGPSAAGSYAGELAPMWGERAAVLAALADGYPATDLAGLAAAAQRIGDVYRQAHFLLELRRLAPAELAGRLAAQTARLLRSAGNDAARARWLPTLLSGPGAVPLDDVLDGVIEIGSVSLRASALAECAKLAGSAAIVEAMDAIPDPGWRAYAYCLSGLPLDPTRIGTAGRDLWELDGEIDRSMALAAIAARLPDPLMRDTLKTVLALDDHRSLGLAMSDLANGMSEAVARDTYQHARELTDPARRFAATAHVAYRLPVPLCDTAAVDLLRASDGDPREHARRGLQAICPHLSHDQRQRALAQAATLADPAWRAETTTMLLPGLPDAELSRQSERALSLVMSLEPGWDRDELLSSLLPVLPATSHQEAMRAANTITDEWGRLAALRSLAAHLPEPDRRKVLADVQRAKLEAARTADDDLDRHYAIKECVEADPGGVDAELALALAQVATSMTDPHERGPAMTACAPALARAARLRPADVWNAIRPRGGPRRRADLLEDLHAVAPVLPALGGETAIARIADTVLYVAECWP